MTTVELQFYASQKKNWTYSPIRASAYKHTYTRTHVKLFDMRKKSANLYFFLGAWHLSYTLTFITFDVHHNKRSILLMYFIVYFWCTPRQTTTTGTEKCKICAIDEPYSQCTHIPNTNKKKDIFGSLQNIFIYKIPMRLMARTIFDFFSYAVLNASIQWTALTPPHYIRKKRSKIYKQTYFNSYLNSIFRNKIC